MLRNSLQLSSCKSWSQKLLPLCISLSKTFQRKVRLWCCTLQKRNKKHSTLRWMGSKEGFESICEARAQADHVIMASHWSTSSYQILLTSWASSQLTQALLRFNLELKALETSLTWKKSHQKHVPSLGPRVFHQIRIWNKLKLDDTPTDQVRFDLRLLNPNKKPRLKQIACGRKDFTTQTLKSCMSSLFFSHMEPTNAQRLTFLTRTRR